MTTRIITKPQQLDQLVKLLAGYKFPFTVTVAKGKHRSVEQNRLQRLWLKEAEDQLDGHTAEDIRGYCKLAFGVPILRRDDEAYDHEWQTLMAPKGHVEQLALMKMPFDLAVTRVMTTKQKHEYLERMSQFLIERGCALTEPQQEH